MTTPTDFETPYRFGLRFSKSQARVLSYIAMRIEMGELGNQHRKLFVDAADAARKGEPLIVHCSQPIEAVMMADGFTRFGVVRPDVEDLNHLGGDPGRGVLRDR